MNVCMQVYPPSKQTLVVCRQVGGSYNIVSVMAESLGLVHQAKQISCHDDAWQTRSCPSVGQRSGCKLD